MGQAVNSFEPGNGEGFCTFLVTFLSILDNIEIKNFQKSSFKVVEENRVELCCTALVCGRYFQP